MKCSRTAQIIKQFRGYHVTLSIHTLNIFYLSNSIPAKPLHNHDIVSGHFNHFYCTGVCDKLSSDIAMLTYIYFNVDDC